MPDRTSRRDFANDQYTVVLSLGSNLGNSEELIGWVVARARATGAAVAVSGMYTTEPWGVPDQPVFRNATCIVTGERTPAQWLLWGHDLEAKALRVRGEQRWGPRTLDVDIIAATWIGQDGRTQEVRSDDPVLTIPHPRAGIRAFVLVPWLEVDPEATCAGRPLAAWLAELDATEVEGVRRTGEVPVIDTEEPPTEGPVDPGTEESR